MYKKYIVLILVNFSYVSPHSIKSPIVPLQEIHGCLFDLIFPENQEYSIEDQATRLIVREQTWHYVQHDKNLCALLQPLTLTSPFFPHDIQQMFPDIMTEGFARVSQAQQEQFLHALRRHPDNVFRAYACNLRKLYTFLAYSTPLTNKLANIILHQQKPHDVTIDLPTSKLHVEHDMIVHEDGLIDYLIIGSGPAGCLIAHELARHKKDCRIVVLEAGSFVKPGSIITEFASELMESGNSRTTVSGSVALRNGWTVGGGTTVNLDLAFSPLLPWTQNRLQKALDLGYISEDLCGSQDNNWSQLRSAYDWVKQKVQTRKVDEDEINNNNKILFQAIETAQTYNLNARKPTDNPNEILKISAVDAFLLPALQGDQNFQSNVSLIANAKTTRIVFDDSPNKIATGVEIVFQPILDKSYVLKDHNNFHTTPGTTATIKAKNIIVSAGSLGSSEILLRSDLNNDTIGTGVILHPSLGIFARFKQEINVLEGLSASVYALAKL